MFMSCSVNVKKQVEDQIQNNFNKVEGNFALAFIMIDDTENSILINEKEMFHAASTMKTPVMIEAFKQDEKGIISLQDSLLVKNSFKSIVDSSEYSMDINRDSGDKAYAMIGKKIHFII